MSQNQPIALDKRRSGAGRATTGHFEVTPPRSDLAATSLTHGVLKRLQVASALTLSPTILLLNGSAAGRIAVKTKAIDQPITEVATRRPATRRWRTLQIDDDLRLSTDHTGPRRKSAEGSSPSSLECPSFGARNRADTGSVMETGHNILSGPTERSTADAGVRAANLGL